MNGIISVISEKIQTVNLESVSINPEFQIFFEENGRGYVVDIRTDVPYRDVVSFYADRYRQTGFRVAPGLGNEFAVGDIRTGDRRILLEIHSRDTQTYVTMAVHLGEWW